MWWGAVTTLTAQVITTVAGTDFSFPPTPRPALDSPIGLIEGLAVDPKGNLYISDLLNNQVFRVTPDGTLTVAAGNGIAGASGEGGPATAASINPGDIGVDPAGNLFIISSGRFRKVSGGILSTIPNVAAPSTVFGSVAFDSTGVMYYTDSIGQKVYKVVNGAATLIAGTGKQGFSGDGGPALSATFNFPGGLAVDATGNVYIADGNNQRIRRIAPDGTISTIAGTGDGQNTGDGGPATSAAITPVRIAIGPDGSLYIAAGFGGVRKISRGTITTLAKTTSGYVAVDSAGTIYTNTIFGLSTAVSKLNPDGSLTPFAGNNRYRFTGDGGPASSASLYFNQSPSGVVADAAGNVYISDSYSNRIRKISNGVITTIAGNGTPGFSGDGPALTVSLNNPAGLALAPNGDLYVADSGNNRIRKISGGVITTVAGTGQSSGGPLGDNGPATSALLFAPLSIAIDSKGDLYICDSYNYRIRKVSGGIITTVAGNGTPGSSGDGGPATAAALGPVAVAVDNAGNIYEADFSFNVVRKISNGVITRFAGNGTQGFSGDNGPATSAALFGPYSLTVDSSGAVYIGEFYNNRIRKVANGIITTVAGSGAAGLLGDGGPATAATTTHPGAIFVDSAGNLFLSDVFFSRVREVLASPPSVLTSPTQLNFSASAGGAIPPVQTVSLSSAVPGLAFGVKPDSNAPWLSVSPGAGALPRLLDFTADPTSLDPGTYTATIVIATPNATPVSRNIAVTFTLSAPLPPQLSIDTQSLSFPFPANAQPRTLPVMVSNSGGGQLDFTASAATNNGGPWLSVNPSSGSALPNAPVLLNVTAAPGALAPGTYTGTVTVTPAGSGGVQTVAITMTVSATGKSLLLSQTGLSFLGVAQGGILPPQTFGVINIGAGVVRWTVTKSTLSGGPDWLQTSVSNGTSDASAAVPQVSVTANAAALAPGKYYGQVRVSSPDADNSPQLLTVFLQVLPAGTDIGPASSTTELLFAATQNGGSPGSLDFLIYNVAAAPKAFRTSSAADSGLTLSVLPTDGTLDPQRPNRIVVQPVTTGLAPGVYNGSVTFQFSDGRVRNVRVSVVVAAGSGSLAQQGSSRGADGCTPSKLVTALTTLGASFTVSAGWPVAIAADVKNDCGATLDSGSVTVTFSNGDVPLTLRSIGGGRWETTWQTGSPTNSVILKLQASDPAGALRGEREIAGSLQTQTDPPVFDKPGIVSGASGKPFIPIAPGSIVSIYGNRLAQGTVVGSGATLSTTLSSTSVLIGGLSAPLYFVSPGQVNVQVPYGLKPNTTHQILVTQGLTYSRPVAIDVASAQPAVFVDTSVSAAQGIVFAVRNQGGGQVQFEARPGSPAQAGDVLVIYCAGLGTVSPSVADGASAIGLSSTDTPVQVSIGGVTATPFYAGLAPGFVGLYQVNVAVPSGLPAGDAVPLTLTLAGQTSPVVSVALK